MHIIIYKVMNILIDVFYRQSGMWQDSDEFTDHEIKDNNMLLIDFDFNTMAHYHVTTLMVIFRQRFPEGFL